MASPRPKSTILFFIASALQFSFFGASIATAAPTVELSSRRLDHLSFDLVLAHHGARVSFSRHGDPVAYCKQLALRYDRARKSLPRNQKLLVERKTEGPPSAAGLDELYEHSIERVNRSAGLCRMLPHASDIAHAIHLLDKADSVLMHNRSPGRNDVIIAAMPAIAHDVRTLAAVPPVLKALNYHEDHAQEADEAGESEQAVAAYGRLIRDGRRILGDLATAPLPILKKNAPQFSREERTHLASIADKMISSAHEALITNDTSSVKARHSLHARLEWTLEQLTKRFPSPERFASSLLDLEIGERFSADLAAAKSHKAALGALVGSMVVQGTELNSLAAYQAASFGTH